MLEKSDYCTLFNDAISRKETILLGCQCTVRYSGRAESYLHIGDRIIIIKSDDALLIHQPAGNAPVNYMKPGSYHKLIVEDNELVLHTSNIIQKEKLRVLIKKIHFFNTHKLEDGASIVLQGTEKDMSDLIYENPELIEKGFKAASREEQTKYGFIDVLGIDKEGRLTIVECKRYQADLGAVTQLRRYVEKIIASKGILDVRGIIAAPKITANALKMLEDWGFSFVKVKPPKYLEEFDKQQQTLNSF